MLSECWVFPLPSRAGCLEDHSRTPCRAGCLEDHSRTPVVPGALQIIPVMFLHGEAWATVAGVQWEGCHTRLPNALQRHTSSRELHLHRSVAVQPSQISDCCGISRRCPVPKVLFLTRLKVPPRGPALKCASAIINN